MCRTYTALYGAFPFHVLPYFTLLEIKVYKQQKIIAAFASIKKSKNVAASGSLEN